MASNTIDQVAQKGHGQKKPFEAMATKFSEKFAISIENFVGMAWFI